MRQPRPLFLNIRDIWQELEASRGMSVAQFLDGLIFRKSAHHKGGTSPVDAVYDASQLHTCSECGVTELDAIITSGLCEECLCATEMDEDETQIDRIRKQYFGSVL